EAAIPILLQVIKDPDEEWACDALQRLGALGPKAQSAVPYIRKVFASSNSLNCSKAAFALAHILESDAIPMLAEELRVGNSIAREEICVSLTTFGADAEPAIDALLLIMRSDASSKTRAMAGETIGHIRVGTKRVPMELLDALRMEKDDWARIGIAGGI